MILVERLRAPVPRSNEWIMRDFPDGRSEGPFDPVRLEAADQIERLERALETARVDAIEAKKRIAAYEAE